MIMIQDIPFAIYINDLNDTNEYKTDNSLNSLPLSVQIVPHNPEIIIENAIIVKRRCKIFNSYDPCYIYTNKITFICQTIIFFLFAIPFIAAIVSFLIPVN